MAMIPVLLLVFVAVLLPGDEEESDKAVPSYPAPTVTATEETAASQRRNVQWPTYALANVTRHNPFELSDPRAILDAEMLMYGITGPESMTEIPLEEFLGRFQEIDAAAEASFIAELMDWTSPHQDTEEAAQAKISTEPPKSPGQEDAQPDETEPLAQKQFEQDVLAQKRRLAELQNQPITMFMTTHRGPSVLLGDRTIVEGEMVEDGIRVASIDRSGVTFELVLASDPPKPE